ncbi:N-acetylmuramoyl-L-alanine amidase [Chryseobacterium binzhouense]|uniref:N-acetylmuramoyl-L-alanine amidase n=1 Tax=Chryseobacterium binzhouense TaxID=2593646 RepID=UPI00117EBD0A|nr:N-acetylmuramoyl-L-alanine amidase [Chryseobacterium binzhouense]MXS72697.1 N-acetylmuramoyl-L-alanine amidase [Flavobacteriaceae bacterium W22]
MIQFSPLRTFLSAGHHDKDPGAVANGYKEADVTKLIRDSIVRNSGDKDIVVDKDWENNRQYQNRIKPGAGSVVFDIHLNAAGNNTTRGVESYVNRKDFADKNSASYKMADEVNLFLSKELGIKNRGVKPENNSQHSTIGILNLGSGIAVLVEVDFITGAGAVENIMVKKDIIGKGLAKILKKYDDLM